MNSIYLGNPIASGNTADIFLHENKVIKIFKDHLPSSEAMKEASKQKLAHSAGIPVPEVLDVSRINGKQSITMEYVPGKTLGELFFEDKRQAEEHLMMSVDIQQQIHRIIPKSFERMRDKLGSQIASVSQLDKRRKSNLLSKLNSIKFEERLCHGDFHLFNLILADNKVVIIDWVDSSAGDIRADVYRTYLLYSQFYPDLAEKYVSLYCQKTGLLRSDIFEWASIIAAARLSEKVSTENEERLLKIINH
ncbi:phosphotransferase family protein [Rossellomorea vietnamensis]|uniref:phosphotransferase family protein n=1 Tax=Rossellomorea vietnamensis TaxID=218284 RepID=UPI003CE829E8